MGGIAVWGPGGIGGLGVGPVNRCVGPARALQVAAGEYGSCSPSSLGFPVARNSLLVASDLEMNRSKTERRYDVLEERLKAIEGSNTFDSIDPNDLCLIPKVILTPKFKVLDFKKFDGTHIPQTHLRLYCQKMAAHADDESMQMKPNETFREYVHRWRDMSIQVSPPVEDREVISLFMNTLKDPYFGHLLGETPYDFMDIVS
ncbi:uncharacterized protein LOC131158667 [Malania oleifera]|uniref:uncharacterized protein LOC131158667 n=1 Tax=Malania oleifera TaxID=397392 RepID=UPI0025AE1473|nr:uncharacterized protein LOC131158667 [Malania oleifera]